MCALMHIYQDSIPELCVHGDKKQAVIFVDAGPLVHGIGIRYQFSVAAVFGHVYERTGGMMNKLCHVPCTLQLIGNSMNKL